MRGRMAKRLLELAEAEAKCRAMLADASSRVAELQATLWKVQGAQIELQALLGPREGEEDPGP